MEPEGESVLATHRWRTRRFSQVTYTLHGLSDLGLPAEGERGGGALGAAFECASWALVTALTARAELVEAPKGADDVFDQCRKARFCARRNRWRTLLERSRG